MVRHTFISYAHENTRFALKLARQLQKQGLAVQLDQWGVSAEDEWNRAIERMIRRCDNFLIVLSPEAVNSWVVRDQFLLALSLNKTIVPVLYRACNIPVPLQSIPYIDFANRDFKSSFSQLLARYFPKVQINSGYWPKVKSICINSVQNWWNVLGPLLWPGWLGPAIVLLLVLMAVLIYRRSDHSVVFGPTPQFETLAVAPPTQSPVPTVEPVATKVRTRDGQIMALIAAGEFLMGSDSSDTEANSDEKPQHSVYVDSFWIDKTEVSNSQYNKCVEAEVCRPSGALTSIFTPAELPVVGVSWAQANTYCRWVGGRLPTEAEWEKTARGTDGRLYPWGDDFDGSRLNYCDANCIADWRDATANDGYRYTAPPGSYPAGASPYGVLDMSGNVWEWTADWYAPDSYKNSIYRNPTGPESGLQRVVRGGSWYYYGKNLRAAKRHKDTPVTQHDNIGFRCVISDHEQAAGPPSSSRRFFSRGMLVP